MELELIDPIERAIYAERYEPAVIGLIRRLLHPGETFLDVGAHVGYISCVAADCVGTSGQVHAFEPEPRLFKRLERLKYLNPEYRIYPVNLAAGDEDGYCTLYQSNGGNSGWNTLVPGFMPREQVRVETLVRVRPLDSYIREASLESVHFIKIDVEGFEYRVLRGLEQCIRRHYPWILCEIAPSAYPVMGITPSSLEQFLFELGYEVRGLDLLPIRLETLERTTNVVFVQKAQKI